MRWLESLRRSGESNTLFEMAVYLNLALSYLLGVLNSERLTLWPFLLFTTLNVAWLTIFTWMEQVRDTVKWSSFQLVALIALGGGIILLFPLRLGYDWLIVIVTTSIVALSRRWPYALAVVIGFMAISALAFTVAGASSGSIVQMLLQTGPAYLFAAIYSVTLRRQWSLRAQAEDLAHTLAKANSELEAAHQELRLRAAQAEDLATARERNRMAREIHDTLGHHLTVLAVELETALKLEEHGETGLHAELEKAREAAKTCLSEVRRSVAALRPAELSSASLEDALAHLVRDAEALSPQASFTLDVEGCAELLSPEQRAVLYRCVQEALTNIHKHASATKVLIRLRVGDPHDNNVSQVELTVLDNGGVRTGDSTATAGFGLLGMRERVEALGGALQAGAEPDRGWRVEARLPLRAEKGLRHLEAEYGRIMSRGGQ